MPQISLSKDSDIFYIERNPARALPASARTVLLLHGLGANATSWQLQIPEIEQAGYRVIAPDVRGFGRSSYRGGGMSPSALAGDIAALLERLDTGPANVVGISMGGVIALQLVLDHPELVDKLILVNTFASLRPKSTSVWLYFAWRFILIHLIGFSTQAKAVTKRIFPKSDQEELRQELYREIMQANPSAYRSVMIAMARFDVSNRLQEIQAPTLILTGEDDTTVPPGNQAVLVAGIPNARQIIIPDSGHAMIAEQTEEFNRLLIEFLNEKMPGIKLQARS